MQLQGLKSSVDQDDIEMLIVGARENIYSYPIRTAVQEYVNNGKDSNREAGNPDHMMDIDVPDSSKPVIRIRDYGTGLSPEGVDKVYRWTGKSTKRGRVTKNGTKLTGKYGIGGKIGYKICDVFNVNSYYNGIKYEFMAHKMNHKIGQFDMINQSPTTEPNGLEIILPLRSNNDIQVAKDAIRRIFEFWTVKPNFNKPLDFKKTLYENDDLIIKENSGFGVLLDGTPYSLTTNDYDLDRDLVKLLSEKWHNNVYFKAQVDELEVPMNREFIEKDEKLRHFIDGLKNKLIKAEAEILGAFKSKQFSTYSDLRSAWSDLLDVVRTNCDYHSDIINRDLECHPYGKIEIVGSTADTFTFHRKERKNQYVNNRICSENISYTDKFILGRLKKMTDYICIGVVPEEMVRFFDMKSFKELNPTPDRIVIENKNKYFNIKTTNGMHSMSLRSFLMKFEVTKECVFMSFKDYDDNIAEGIEKMNKIKGVEVKVYGISKEVEKALISEGITLIPAQKVEITDVIRKMAEDYRIYCGVRNTTLGSLLKHMDEPVGNNNEIEVLRFIYHKVNLNRSIYEIAASLCDSDVRIETILDPIHSRYPFLTLTSSYRTDNKEIAKWFYTLLQVSL